MPSHNEKGIALIKRTVWFNSHIETVMAFPKYNAIECSGEINTRRMHPQRATVESGIAIIFANKNSTGS
jgi:hypothetical protein